MKRETFERVWERVCARELPGAAAQGAEQSRLGALLRHMDTLEQDYEWLRGHSGGSSRALALLALRELRAAAEEWQTEYFLLAGDSCPRPAARPAESGVLSMLGRLYRAEGEGIELCRRAAESGVSPQLAAQCRQQTGCAERRRETLRGLLRSAMG